jgi:hypothetical protein
MDLTSQAPIIAIIMYAVTVAIGTVKDALRDAG